MDVLYIRIFLMFLYEDKQKPADGEAPSGGHKRRSLQLLGCRLNKSTFCLCTVSLHTSDILLNVGPRRDYRDAFDGLSVFAHTPRLPLTDVHFCNTVLGTSN